MSGLPNSAQERKQYPIASGVVDYFPLALIEIARVSAAGGQQHNPGKPLFWDRSKSGDESDALMRHFLDRGKFDTDGLRHSAKVAWRALALLQKELEDAALPPVPTMKPKVLFSDNYMYGNFGDENSERGDNPPASAAPVERGSTAS